jgi:glucokinase
MAAGAVDVGGTKIAVGLVDETGRILAQEQRLTEPLAGVEAGLSNIGEMLRACLQRRPDLTLEGIGIGCTGPVEPDSGVLGPNHFLLGWEGHSLQARLAETFGVPAATENDADAAALAESRWGAGQGAARCIYITVSTGIGGGLVLDGRLYRGVDRSHPELGHHVIDPAGPACFCGMRGCWESLASGPALAAWYQGQTGQPADARAICRLAEQGDPAARQAVEREGYYLGLGMANLVSLFAPEVIVLGGGVMESWPLFEGSVRKTIRESCRLVPHEKTRLERASLGARTGLAGAGAVWFHRAG